MRIRNSSVSRASRDRWADETAACKLIECARWLTAHLSGRSVSCDCDQITLFKTGKPCRVGALKQKSFRLSHDRLRSSAPWVSN